MQRDKEETTGEAVFSFVKEKQQGEGRALARRRGPASLPVETKGLESWVPEKRILWDKAETT